MSEAIQQEGREKVFLTKSSVVSPVIPPTSRLNFIRNWWQRSAKTSSIAEARIIQRIYGALPNAAIGIPTMARIGKINIDKETLSSNKKCKRHQYPLYITKTYTTSPL